MTSIVAIGDRTCMGPFHSRKAFVPALTHKVRLCAPLAVPGLIDAYTQAGWNSFTYFTTRSPEIGNHKLEIWLHTETNADVKAALPCETWKLIYFHVANDQPSLTTDQEAGQMLEMAIHGTFLTKAAAETAGLGVAREVLGEDGVEEIDVPGEGKVWIYGRDPTKFIQISHDNAAAYSL